MNDSKAYTTGSVTSKDGTSIGYRQTGSGPGVILVHGGMMTAKNFLKLAGFLSSEFTVYIPDRRGRGLSGPFGPNYGIGSESEDLQALIHQTATDKIFGLSSGAIGVLQTAIIEPGLKKVVLYEPPIPVSGTDPAAWSSRYESALSRGNFGKAMFTAIKGTDDPSLFTALPAFLVAPLLNMGINADAKKQAGDDVPLKSLIPTVHYDLILVRESSGMIDRCKDIKAEILLMGGTRSQRYLKLALDALSATLPQAKRVVLQGLGHIAADNDGNPERIAKELKVFFQSGNR
ncbi:alpha/beta fold hydrolase [Chitinophaga nivalis]|uniref:Alpha/beta hydrolase n=1 Tax=Chitinophaga nivalis TaxID=2991709 RepID=A0ABT3IIA8_9BACT|nr:alpha/beta hydrolase [Chitinophaga nivalis]MCW3466637.1 alpha/beta hydrolase [Chitinophaga nivalis]MCW3483672.1 alpha/beta hydrolase [Chitinophaga nivalis]